MDLTEKTLSTREIYAGRVIKVRVDTVSLPDGNQSIREIVEHTGAVAVLAVDNDNNIVMAHQFRKPLDRVLTEIPAGSLYEGEDPLACAQRELEEETGFKARHWEKILSYYSAPGFTNEQLHIYLAGGLFPGQTNPDPDEFIETQLVPLEKAYRMIFSGDIVDGKSIIAIQYLASRRLQSLPEK
ncbi:MAG: NUDIX hydrolase [Syntrophomonadaceae bacterium]